MLLEKRLAILGVGKMGGALAGGLVRSGAMRASHLRLYDSHASRAHDFSLEIGGEPLPLVTTSAIECVEGSDIILLAVKPPIISQVLQDLAPHLSSDQLVISIAAGVRLQKMEALLSASVPVIRAMPNTPALVGEGATALSPGIHATPAHIAQAQALFSAVGISVVVEERLMDAVTGLSGSGPAYIYMVIEALMDGGVKAGLTRDTARQLAAQTVYGAAKMVLASDDHPAELKDNVTTPGGTTIAALAVLERAGLRIALMDAIEAAAARSKEMS